MALLSTDALVLLVRSLWVPCAGGPPPLLRTRLFGAGPKNPPALEGLLVAHDMTCEGRYDICGVFHGAPSICEPDYNIKRV